jgi:anthranilate phosphoribosyltransferase
MHKNFDRELGAVINRLIQKEDLPRNEAKNAFTRILKNEVTQMQQGAFLAALTAKGETENEVAAGWEAIYDLDTKKVTLSGHGPVVENSGTGMDTFKTFNISTAASVIAAGGGIRMARHGARAITSVCGTVDMAEALGVDVECSADLVAESIDRAGIGLFNGMSPNIHPMALGRILSNISFGSTLNIAASLANPALPKRAVRGVYNRRMLLPVIKVMKAIGYKRAVVLYGAVDGTDRGMDEASVCGTTFCAELSENGDITTFDFRPADYDMPHHDSALLSPDNDMNKEAKRFVSLLRGRQHGARTDAALLNAGLIFYVAGKAHNIKDGVKQAAAALRNGNAFNTFENWVAAQNRYPEKGLARLNRLAGLN